MFSVFEISTDSRKTTFDIDWIMICSGGFFASKSFRIFSISFFSPFT